MKETSRCSKCEGCGCAKDHTYEDPYDLVTHYGKCETCGGSGKALVTDGNQRRNEEES